MATQAIHPAPSTAVQMPPAYSPEKDDRDIANDAGYGCTSYLLIGISYLLTIIFFPITLCMGIKIVQEYERAVIFRLGRLLPGGAKGPGLFFIVPCIDTYRKVDLRVVSFQVPPQEVLTKDSVTVSVDAVIYYRVKNATIAVTNVENAEQSTKLLAMTTLRNTLGVKTLAEILAGREEMSAHMQSALDEVSETWGVRVERVEIKDVSLPTIMQRSMAAIAEAQREAEAKIVAAKGEQEASMALREAALTMADTPAALQLRYLQTLTSISAERNTTTVVFPFPIDLMSTFANGFANSDGAHKMTIPAQPPTQHL
uniref:PHB domain-containing protein n=1 Tax=Panagrellus redivivus TaxID=6233 RepID=A0A7E4V5I7_PANRE